MNEVCFENNRSSVYETSDNTFLHSTPREGCERSGTLKVLRECEVQMSEKRKEERHKQETMLKQTGVCV